jgi:hypothetical protein
MPYEKDRWGIGGEGAAMNVARWVVAGIGIGACGGFVAGLLRPRQPETEMLWRAAEEPVRSIVQVRDSPVP